MKKIFFLFYVLVLVNCSVNQNNSASIKTKQMTKKSLSKSPLSSVTTPTPETKDTSSLSTSPSPTLETKKISFPIPEQINNIDADLEFLFQTFSCSNGKIMSHFGSEKLTSILFKINDALWVEWVHNVIPLELYHGARTKFPTCIYSTQGKGNKINMYFEKDTNDKYILWHYANNIDPIYLYIKQKIDKIYWLQIFDPKTKTDLNAALVLNIDKSSSEKILSEIRQQFPKYKDLNTVVELNNMGAHRDTFKILTLNP